MAQSDHLEPTSGIFDCYDFQFEYYSKVRKVLFQGLTNKPLTRFLILPSFTPENVLDIEFDRTNKKYFLVYHICERMIANNDNWEQTKLTKIRKEISKESALLIKELFETAIQGTKYPSTQRIGLDGENYYFTVNMGKLKTGTIWSPSAGTKMWRLVNIELELIRLAKSDKELIKIEDKLKENIIQLTTELK